MFDDGTGGGPAMYAAGRFTAAGGVPANCIAKWDGTRWSALGSGLNEEVFALQVFDDGSGPALFAGGLFTSAGGSPALRLAKWDGSAWSDVGGGVAGGTAPIRVAALAVYDAGEGEELYVGGQFATGGGVRTQGIARWNGRAWNSVGGGVAGFGGLSRVLAITAVPPGATIPEGIYAGGAFTSAGGVSANRIARWDGSSWTALGSGVNAPVNAITTFDDGSGVAIYAAGAFTMAGGNAANRVARWDGTSWAPLGSGVNQEAFALAGLDRAGERALYIGGGFTTAGGGAVKHLARWDGGDWTPVGESFDHWVRALAVADVGQGPRLVSGGYFSFVGNSVVDHIAIWNGAAWEALGSGFGQGSSVGCLAAHAEPAALPVLYAGGNFRTSGAQPVFGIAQWDGVSWSAVGAGLGGCFGPFVFALTHFDDGIGSDLYAGGWFTTAGEVQVNNIARWDGQAWSALGDGLGSECFQGVYALGQYASKTGSRLVAGGDFTQLAGAPADFLAQWDGRAWSSLGEGVSGGFTPSVLAIEQFDDGVEAALYVAGSFTAAGGHAASNIAKWNGTAWSALGSGVDGTVQDLIVFDEGSGPRLFVGGPFVTAGGVAAPGIARWDGVAWSAVGSGIPGEVSSMAIYDDGSGAALFAGVAGTSSPGIYKWDGTVWTPLSPNIAGSIYALLPFDDGLGAGPALIVGGSFTTSPAGDSTIARWQGCPPEFCSGDLDGNGSIDAADLAALLGAWSTPAADLDGDGVTGASDLATLLGGWGSCQ